LEALLRQSMKVREKRAVRQQKGRGKAAEATNERDRGGSTVRESRGIGTTAHLCSCANPCFLSQIVLPTTLRNSTSAGSLVSLPSTQNKLNFFSCSPADGRYLTGHRSRSEVEQPRGRIGSCVCHFGPHRCVLPVAGFRLPGKSSRVSDWDFFS
jgi:hypothetical protein